MDEFLTIDSGWALGRVSTARIRAASPDRMPDRAGRERVAQGLDSEGRA
ncbi:hypothetical protein HII28_04710 [Planctomonas sp. JC2975]|nr:hypothetical protein [Planctomonas sp. JC2975]NNC11179.1 hypothetical protein [Planctomonas sp. JC2975]